MIHALYQSMALLCNKNNIIKKQRKHLKQSPLLFQRVEMKIKMMWQGDYFVFF